MSSDLMSAPVGNQAIRRSEIRPPEGLKRVAESAALRGRLEGMLGVDHVHVVRHKVPVEGRSQRQVARELGVRMAIGASRGTVMGALRSRWCSPD